MEYILVQNQHGHNRQMIHKNDCRYIKNIRPPYIKNLGNHCSLRSAIVDVQCLNINFGYCKYCFPVK